MVVVTMSVARMLLVRLLDSMSIPIWTVTVTTSLDMVVSSLCVSACSSVVIWTIVKQSFGSKKNISAFLKVAVVRLR